MVRTGVNSKGDTVLQVHVGEQHDSLLRSMTVISAVVVLQEVHLHP